MTETADRFRKVAADFTSTVDAVPADAWDNPTPCEGWVARDVVSHLTEWMPGFLLGTWGADAPEVPPVADDPAAAWAVVRDAVQAALDNDALIAESRETPMGPMTLGGMAEMAAIPDVLVHRWDLAKAVGLDVRLDENEIARMVEGIGTVDDSFMRSEGMFGPRVDVADDADNQSKVLAFLGRNP